MEAGTETFAVIDELIDQARDQKAEAAKALEARLQEAEEKVRAKAAAELGTSWEVLRQYMKDEVERQKDYRNVHVSIEWTLPPERCYGLQLAPIRIVVGGGYNGDHIYVWQGRNYSSATYDLAHLAAALFEARSHFAEWKKMVEENFISKTAQPLDRWNNKDEAQARAAYTKLVTTLPEQKARWDKAIEIWLNTDAAERRAAEKEKQDQERYNALMADFKATYFEYVKGRDAAVTHNDKIREQLQAQYDVPFDCWMLTYAVRAIDEDGQAYSDENTAILASPEPDAITGEYLRMDGRRVKYFNPVCMEKITRKPSGRISGSYKAISTFGGHLYVPVTCNEAEVQELISKAGFMPLPEAPEIPQELGQWDVRRIMDAVRNSDETGNDVAF